jgi:hypothetical protein
VEQIKQNRHPGGFKTRHPQSTGRPLRFNSPLEICQDDFKMNPAIPTAPPPVTELEFSISNGRCAFLAGEKISFRIKASKPSHIAILIHQSDGRRVVAFPNIWDRDTFLPAGTPVEIPRRESGFDIESGPPFGTDLVEAVAFDSKESLASLLLDLRTPPPLAAGPRPDPVTARAPAARASLLVGSFPSSGPDPALKRPACIDSAPGAGPRTHAHGHAIDI